MSCYNEEKIIEKNNTKINHRQKNRSELTHKVIIKEATKKKEKRKDTYQRYESNI